MSTFDSRLEVTFGVIYHCGSKMGLLLFGNGWLVSYLNIEKVWIRLRVVSDVTEARNGRFYRSLCTLLIFHQSSAWFCCITFCSAIVAQTGSHSLLGVRWNRQDLLTARHWAERSYQGLFWLR